MGQNNYRQRVAAALKANESHNAALVLTEWSKKDPQFRQDPMYYLSCASLHLAANNLDAVRHNLTSALELMGK